MSATIKIDTREFTDTLRRYRKLSSRDPATIANTKAFYIARRATVETPKADKGEVRKELAQMIFTRKNAKDAFGALGNRTLRRSAKAGRTQAPVAALLINARRGRRGEPGLFGQKMADAIAALVGARMRSVAFLKSGWIPAIKRLEPFAERRGVPKHDRTAKTYGQPKGDATPAKDGGWKATSIIENLAGANKGSTQKDALAKYGGPALQRAFDAEQRSMEEYIDRKMRETADKAGIKHN